ncbi:MAG: hypothetical protein IJC45_07360 [Clostridia bacterium]|nr:hypothetical protein [Clostridia bacterium]
MVKKYNRFLLIFYIGNAFLLFVLAPVPIGFSFIEGAILSELFSYQLFSENLTYDHVTTVLLLLAILLSVGIRILLLLKPTNRLNFLIRFVYSFLFVDMLVCLISQIYYIIQESKDNGKWVLLSCIMFSMVVCVLLLLWILIKAKEKQKIAIFTGYLLFIVAVP